MGIKVLGGRCGSSSGNTIALIKEVAKAQGTVVAVEQLTDIQDVARCGTFAAAWEAYLTSNTGTVQWASTCVATEPITRLPSALWPWEPIITRSNLPAAAVLAIISPAEPTL